MNSDRVASPGTAQTRVTPEAGQPLPYIPARANAGLGDPYVDREFVVTDMTVTAAMRTPDGAVVPGALAVLADSAIGFGIVHSVPYATGMVTSHLHLEIVRTLPSSCVLLRCLASFVSSDGVYALGSGRIVDGDGAVVALATVGAVLLAPSVASSEDHPTVPVSPFFPDVEALLGTEFVSATATGCTQRFRATTHVGNLHGGVHGGMGVLMAERTMHRALQEAAGESERRLVALDATYPRPVGATGASVRCDASVVHLGRRLAVLRAELHDERDRPAVLVDATYVTSPPAV